MLQLTHTVKYMSTMTQTLSPARATRHATRHGRPASRPRLVSGRFAAALLLPHSMVTIIAVSIARGIGFGLSTVVIGALVAASVPAERRGEGIGLAGVVASFLPLTAGVSAGVATLGLFAQAVTATASRWWAGRHGDRHGHAGLLIPGLLIAAAGMASLIWVSAPVAVIAGMCLFGIGFGIAQNVTFALMIDRAPGSGYGTASALWNLAYDAGYGTGPIVFGLFVAHTGYPAAFALTGLLILAALLPAVRDRRQQGRRPGSE